MNNGGGDDDGNTHGSGSGTGSGSGSGSGTGNEVLPAGGLWHYTGVTLVSNTCNASISRGQNGNFGIDLVTSPSFRITPADGTPPFSCTLDHGAFSCPNRAAFVQDLRPGLDAVLTGHVTAQGTFSSTSRATGRQDGTVDCTGAACAVLNPLPCTFRQDFVIEAL